MCANEQLQPVTTESFSYVRWASHIQVFFHLQHNDQHNKPHSPPDCIVTPWRLPSLSSAMLGVKVSKSPLFTTSPLLTFPTLLDVPAILGLIKELADYEKELQSVEATEEKLLSTIAFASSSSSSTSSWDEKGLPITEPITSSRPARCLLIFPPSSEKNGEDSSSKAVGMALYFYNYSTWRAKAGIYLEDLYVSPSERNKGYGKKLLVTLAKEVVAMEGGRLDWSVLKWNEPSIRFYEDVIGATRMEEWVGMRVDREALVKLSKMLG